MDTTTLIALAATGFVVAIFSVAIGGTALIMVPLLIGLGVDTRVAIASNKFATLFLSTVGAIILLRGTTLPYKRWVYAHIIPVVVGSVIGAIFIVKTPTQGLRILIAIATLAIAALLLAKPSIGLEGAYDSLRHRRLALSIIIFLPLSIYGGIFTGGYATLLTYAFVLLLGFRFLEGAAATRLMSVFSTAATSVFLGAHGLIDYRIGLTLATTYSIGAFLGARLALKHGSPWIRRLFIMAAILLAARILALEVYDLWLK